MNLSEKSKKSDKTLFVRLKQKDKEAFVETYDKHVDDIYRFIFYKVNSKEEAEDLTSQVFLKAWNYIQTNSLKDYKTLRALLYKISRNLVIDHYRKKSSKVTFDIDAPESQIDLEDESQNIHEKLEIESDFKAVSENLLKLKDEYREIIIMRYVNEMSFGEIASIINKSKGNVRVILYRAIKALRELSI